MSGVTGWVDFHRDLTRERGTVLAMAATLAHRGPDGEGVWLDRHAALGHRRLTVYDTAGAGQPVVARDGDRVIAAAAHSGSIVNHAQLRQELAARGHACTVAGDTEVLLRAFLAWGPDCVNRFEGTFAGAVWDARTEELWLIRDRLGVEPMFYYPTRDGVIFGSELKAILAHPLVEAAVDAEGLCEILTYSGTPTQAFFRGVHRLRAGHLMRVRAQGSNIQCYWKVTAAPHTDDFDTTVTTIRELLAQSVARNLDADVPVCVLLSGGLDSSAIAALADRTLRPSGGRVRTFTVDFRGHQEDFKPNATRPTRDTPYATDVVNHLDADHTFVLLDPQEMADPVARAAVLRAKDFPTPLGDMNTSLYLLARAVQQSASIALTGEAADSLFHGVGWNRTPREANSGTFPWVARGIVPGVPHGFSCGMLDPGLLDLLDPLAYAQRQFQSSIAEAPHLPGSSGAERQMRELCYVHLTNFMENQNAHTERLFKAVGLQVRMPYCDHRLVQYAYNLPWGLQNFDGREKGLLRTAMRDVLPASVIERQKTPYPVTADAGYAAALRAELVQLLDDSAAPVNRLLNRAAVKAVLDDPDSLRGGWVQRGDVEMALQLNAWLCNYHVRLAL